VDDERAGRLTAPEGEGDQRRPVAQLRDFEPATVLIESGSAPSRPPGVLDAQVHPAPREIVRVKTGPDEKSLIVVPPR